MSLNSARDLVDWADIIRKTFFDGGVEEIISTSTFSSCSFVHMAIFNEQSKGN